MNGPCNRILNYALSHHRIRFPAHELLEYVLEMKQLQAR